MTWHSAALLLLLAAPPQDAQRSEGAAALQVRIDRRVELLGVLARLAGFEEFHSPEASSPYARAVDEWFSPLREEEAVHALRRLRAKAGVSYDAIPLLAVHFTDPPSFEPRFDLLAHPGRLADRWDPEEALRFAELVRDFAEVSDCEVFFEEQAPYLRATAERLRQALVGQLDLGWFAKTLGEKPGARFQVVPMLLAGPNNFGVGVRFPDGTEELSPCIGAWRFDGDGLPVFGEELGWVVPHEFAHSYANPLVDRHFDELEPLGRDLHPRVAAVMEGQAYGSWRIVLYESLTRACVLRYLLATEGAAAARTQAERDLDGGFRWVPGLAEWLARYESRREVYPTLEAFMPEVVRFFAEEAERERARDANRPHLVSIRPAPGATRVPPGASTIVLEFDVAMVEGSWSLLKGTHPFPPLRGEPAYDSAGRVLSVPVELAPDTLYDFWINGPRARGFASRNGRVSLDPVHVSFRTAPSAPDSDR